MFFPFIFLSIGALYLGIWFLYDNYMTKRNININQKEWDEYSSNMTRNEKAECFLEFLEENKKKHNWKYYYIPKMKL